MTHATSPKTRTARVNRAAENARPTGRRDDGNAFLPDPSEGNEQPRDSLALDLAENFLTSATSGEESLTDAHNKVVLEELGGPFVTSTGADEFGTDRDSTNPSNAEREALPSPMRGTPEE